MESKTKTDLEKAKALFYSWRLLEAYQIFRRYYDRLPFKPEPEHAEYIGMFTRTLLELGKDWELKFYMSELEKLYGKSKNPCVGFQLALIYCNGKNQDLKSAKIILDEIIKNISASEYHNKSKMLLAYYYDVVEKDVASCKKIIESIKDPVEPALKPLVEIWKGKVLADQGKYSESDVKLRSVMKSTSPKEDWYAHFWANQVLAYSYVEQNRLEDALELLNSVRNIFEAHQFKFVKGALNLLETAIKEKAAPPAVLLEKINNKVRVKSGNKSFDLNSKSLPDKLLLSMMKKKTINKAHIMKLLYEKVYDGTADDQTIGDHLKAVKKYLKELGLPEEAISIEDDKFNFVPEVKWVEGQL
jgi:tetratricopeptide (TPR) repeat protein